MNRVAAEVAIDLLGPLSVHINHRPVMPEAAKPRQILALLALNSGRAVTVATLAEELWGERPPRSAATTLQTYILELRKRMAAAMGPGQDPKWLLRTQYGGYALEAPSGRVDVREFRRLARAGRAAAEGGDARAAAELLGSALTLWRGPALADVRRGRVLEPEMVALEEARLAVLGRRIEVDLVLGRHADVLGELTVLVALHPINENFAALLMKALYRSGYTDRALAEFRRLRSTLLDELGIEPSAQLQRLHHAVLVRDPALDLARYATRRTAIRGARGCSRPGHGATRRCV